MKKKIIAVIDGIEKVCFAGSFVSILLIMFITTFDLLARKFIDYSIPSLYEFTEDYLMVSLVFLSISYVYTVGGHIRVNILERHFPPFLNKILDKIFKFLSLVFFFLIALKGGDACVRAYNFQETSNSVLGYPLAPAYFMVPLGAGLICLRILQSFFKGFPQSDRE